MFVICAFPFDSVFVWLRRAFQEHRQKHHTSNTTVSWLETGKQKPICLHFLTKSIVLKCRPTLFSNFYVMVFVTVTMNKGMFKKTKFQTRSRSLKWYVFSSHILWAASHVTALIFKVASPIFLKYVGQNVVARCVLSLRNFAFGP